MAARPWDEIPKITPPAFRATGRLEIGVRIINSLNTVPILPFDDFFAWYRSETRLAFSRTVVLRYRIELESRPGCGAAIRV